MVTHLCCWASDSTMHYVAYLVEKACPLPGSQKAETGTGSVWDSDTSSSGYSYNVLTSLH